MRAHEAPAEEIAFEPAPIPHDLPDEIEADLPEPGPLRWLLPALAILIALGWIGFAAAMLQPWREVLTPAEIVEQIAAACIPLVLIGIVWLLALRSGTAEARRFGNTARAMRAEAASLERKVSELNDALDASRARLAEQGEVLGQLGDTAAERLAIVHESMTQEMRSAEYHAQRLAETSAGTQASLGGLLASLPRAHSETEELSRALEATGRAATDRAAALEALFATLIERGREADAVAGGAARELAEHIASMEASSAAAGTRLETVAGEMSATVDTMLDRAATAVDQSRQGIAAQGDAMLAMIQANQAALDHAARDTVEALAGRIAAIEAALDRIGARLDSERAAGDALVAGLEAGIGGVETKLNMLHESGVIRTRAVAESIGALEGSAAAMTETLRAGDAMGRTVIATAEEVLTALDATAREVDETLPEALARLDARIAQSRAVVGAAKPELLALVTAAESTHTAIEAIAEVIAGQRATLDTLSATLIETLDSGRDKADALGAMVDEAVDRTRNFARDAAPQLVEALLKIRETAAAAADRARETLAAVLPEVSRTLEEASGTAMRRASEISVERQVRAIADATEAAVDAAQIASTRLEAQIAALSEATDTVQARIDEARAEREQTASESFARRASMLIESLNSAAIDLTKSISNEVSDTAWAAYLRGDRGAFTRRAVRLLDGGEAREVARYYDDDGEFREQVNRYIHDFEAMLRGVLAQGDGSPLGVTLLSSDMGKLYVALAQAIERLRA